MSVKTSDQAGQSFQSPLVLVTAPLLVNTHSRALAVLLSPPRGKRMCRFIKRGHQKRKVTKKDGSAAKKQKVITLEVKFKSAINGVIQGTRPGDSGETAPLLGARLLPCSRGGESAAPGGRAARRGWVGPEEAMPGKELTLRELLETVPSTERTGDRALAADANCEGSVTTHPGTGRPLPPRWEPRCSRTLG